MLRSPVSLIEQTKSVIYDNSSLPKQKHGDSVHVFHGYQIITVGGSKRCSDQLLSSGTTVKSKILYFRILSTDWESGRFERGALLDSDSDGDLDFLGIECSQNWKPSKVRLFENNGQGAFKEVTDEKIGDVSVINVGSQTIAVADFNGDGLMDAFLGEGGADESPYPGGQSKLLIQGKNGKLLDKTQSHLPKEIEFCHSVTVGDIDGDGDLDLFKGNIGCRHDINGSLGPRFYINDGTGHFTAEPWRIPSDIIENEDKGYGYIAFLLVDIDKDGDLDMILGIGMSSIYPERDTVLLNDGNGFFSYAPENVLPPRYTEHGFFTQEHLAGDFNGDGWLDLLVYIVKVVSDSDVKYRIQLLINNGDGTFRNESDGITQIEPDPVNSNIQWLETADFNGDGLMDFVASVAGPDEGFNLFINQGNNKFVNSLSLKDWSDDMKLFPGDLDNDGDIDIFGLHSYWYNIIENVRPYKPAKPLKRSARIKLISPGDGSETTTSPTLAWKNKKRALTYRIQICKDQNFSKFTKFDLDKDDLTGNRLELGKLTCQPGFKKLKSGTTYHWRVAGVNYSGQGKWSGVRSFTINAKVTDAGSAHLKNLAGLTTLYMAQTRATEEGIAELREARPCLRVYLHW